MNFMTETKKLNSIALWRRLCFCLSFLVLDTWVLLLSPSQDCNVNKVNIKSHVVTISFLEFKHQCPCEATAYSSAITATDMDDRVGVATLACGY